MREKMTNRLFAPFTVPPTTSPAKNRGALSELRAAINDGWQIVQPIFARPLWTAINDERLAFHFVLQRERATRLVTLPESKTVVRFIRERDLTIDKRANR